MSDLSELFERDPLKLSDQDLQRIIAHMREAQAKFELGAKAPVAERKRKTSTAQAILKDLGLDGGTQDILKDLGLK